MKNETENIVFTAVGKIEKNCIVEMLLDCLWPEKLRVKLKLSALKRLGKRICAITAGKRKSFRWKTRVFTEENGEKPRAFTLYVYGRRSFYRDFPLIRFKYEFFHNVFRRVSVGETTYKRFTSAELVKFGTELLEFDTIKKASARTEASFGLRVF